MTLRRPSDRPTVCPSRNLNMDNISDTNNTRATKLGPKLVCGKTFQSICLEMTLSRGQGHRVTLKIWKNGLLHISRTLITVEPWNLHHIVANDKTFTATYNMTTLTLVQGHPVTFKMWKNGLLDISRTQTTVESWDLYHIVENSKAFTGTYDMMTSILVQGQWLTLRCGKKWTFGHFSAASFSSAVLKLYHIVANGKAFLGTWHDDPDLGTRSQDTWAHSGFAILV